MNLQLSLSFSPVVPWWLWLACLALGLVALAPALIARARGRALRAALFAVLLLLLAGPVLESERLESLSPVALLVHDRSASQGIGERAEQAERALGALEASAARLGIETRRVETPKDGDETLLFKQLAEERRRLEPGRLGAIILVSDGQAHDAARAPDDGTPLHLLLTGAAAEKDRSLRLVQTPRFGLIDRPVALEIVVQSRGAKSDTAPVPVRLRRNGEVIGVQDAVPGVPLRIELELTRRGRNLIEAEIPALEGEMTNANNRVGFEVNAFRDRLRVLLISGQPHAGQRAWRNLLKSDPAVDLVHFNILREDTDDVRAAVSELSLIAFPVDQLFLDDISGFDLVIFDRYLLRGHLRQSHLASIARFVQQGGGLLTVAGPEYAGVQSLYASVLHEVLPAAPVGELSRGQFRPQRTELGSRHPVTKTLTPDPEQPWGPWYYHTRVTPRVEGRSLIAAEDGSPLLVLARVGEGRSALLASDQIWLWARGHDGGGPYAELLRRTVHWLMGEPELEEERLLIDGEDEGAIRIERRSLDSAAGTVRLDGPGGAVAEVELVEEGETGIARARLDAVEPGLWRASAGELEALALVGRNLQRELAEPFSTETVLEPAITASGGHILRLEDKPEATLRRAREGGSLHGASWLGVVDRNPSRVAGVASVPLLPALAACALLLALLLFAWRTESR